MYTGVRWRVAPIFNPVWVWVNVRIPVSVPLFLHKSGIRMLCHLLLLYHPDDLWIISAEITLSTQAGGRIEHKAAVQRSRQEGTSWTGVEQAEK